jgi:hypothetical protein
LLEEIEWGSLWDEEEGSEFKLTFNVEVLDLLVLFPIVSKTLLE